VGGGKVDPGLNLWDLGAPLLRLLGTGGTPGFEHPRPVKKEPGIRDPTLCPPGQLVSLGKVGRVALQRRSCLIEIIGSSPQGTHRGGYW
jgi:hypothetical protein